MNRIPMRMKSALSIYLVIGAIDLILGVRYGTDKLLANK